MIDQAESLRFLSRHPAITVHRIFQNLVFLAGMLDVTFDQILLQTDDFTGLNFDIGRHTLRPAGWLVDHDA